MLRGIRTQSISGRRYVKPTSINLIQDNSNLQIWIKTLKLLCLNKLMPPIKFQVLRFLM
jgi:hypothetical protein